MYFVCLILSVSSLMIQLLHNVTRIAEVSLNLQQAGNVEHSGTIFTFPCAQYDGGDEDPLLNERLGKELTELLQEHAKQLEDALNNWEREIQVARTRYYQLNYYTTLQLLILRREFGKFKASFSTCVLSNVFTLLHSVSPRIENSAVRDAVLRAISEPQLYRMDSKGEEAPIVKSIKVQPKQATGNNNEGTSRIGHILPLHPKDLSERPSTIVDDLNDEQKQILTRSVTFLGYTESHVLRAFQECGPKANKFDIEGWCDNHKDIYNEDVQEEGSAYEDEDEEDNQSTSSESSDDSDHKEAPSKSIVHRSRLGAFTALAN